MIDWNTSFSVVSLSRADIQSARLSKEKIARLTDEDMEAIARKMGNLYHDNGYWEDLAFVVDIYLVGKK